MQTILPNGPWPPQPQTQTDIQSNIYITHPSSTSASSSPICLTTRDTCVFFFLIIGCMASSLLTIGLLGYTGWTGFQIYNSIPMPSIERSDSWRYTDETTLCVSLPAKDHPYSACAQYLFYDDSRNENFTCCVRHSSQYLFLYQLILQEQQRHSSSSKNAICKHANAITEVLHNGTIPWTPAKSCEINGKQTESSTIKISENKKYLVYTSVTIRFLMTFRESPYKRIRVTLYRRHTNSTSGYFEDSQLLSEEQQVRKERQNFENIFMYGIFRLHKDDYLYVKVNDQKYVYNYGKYSYIGVVKI